MQLFFQQKLQFHRVIFWTFHRLLLLTRPTRHCEVYVVWQLERSCDHACFCLSCSSWIWSTVPWKFHFDATFCTKVHRRAQLSLRAGVRLLFSDISGCGRRSRSARTSFVSRSHQVEFWWQHLFFLRLLTKKYMCTRQRTQPHVGTLWNGHTKTLSTVKEPPHCLVLPTRRWALWHD